jgi:hypothetical protein
MFCTAHKQCLGAVESVLVYGNLFFKCRMSFMKIAPTFELKTCPVLNTNSPFTPPQPSIAPPFQDDTNK